MHCARPGDYYQVSIENRFTSASVFLLFRTELGMCTYNYTIEKKTSTTQYGYRKLGTHSRVFSQILEHGNSKNEIRLKKTYEGEKRGVSMERSKADKKKKKSRRPITN